MIERLEERALLNGQSPLLQFPSLVFDPGAYDSSSVLVRFSDTTDLSLPDLPGATLESLPLVNGLHQVRLASGTTVATALAALSADERVAYAQPNYRVSVSYLPNDVQFDAQWALHTPGGPDAADINAPEAWEIVNSSPGVIVAVIDTGIDYNHIDLQDNIWTNPGEVAGNGVDDDNNGYVDDVHGYDFVGKDGDPMDDHGHGTHVAGIIGAVGDNEFGVAGVTWGVQLMPIKFLDGTGSGWLSAAIEALNYAVANGATISNNSWNGGGFDQALADAIATAGAMDHLFVTAAGNGSRDLDLFPSYPASYDLPNILAVAATDQLDQLAAFSNYGHATVDLAAPGVSILSTMPGGYGTLTGTSMAAPFVTGAAALLRGLHGGWSFEQVIDQILSTVEPLPSLEGTTVSGGRLNLAAALNATPNDDVKGPRVVSSNPASYVTGGVSSVRLTFNESINTSTFTTGDVLSFFGPNGPIAIQSVTPVAGSNDRQFDVAFAEQTALGNYTMLLNPDIRDLAGNAMDQNKDGVNGQVPEDMYHAQFTIVSNLVYPSSDAPLAIEDFSITISSLTIDTDMTIADVNVQLDINHPRDADLHIYLVGPTGTTVTLSAYHGEGANFSGTVFDDQAPGAIADGQPPFAGAHRPDDPLAAFDGQNAQGVWMLFIEDWGFGNEGELTGWSLIIKPEMEQTNFPVGNPTIGNYVPFAFNDFISLLEDTPTTINVLANDFDANGDSLFLTSVGNASGGTAVINGDNTVTFTPDPEWFGPASFTYMVSDGLSSAIAQVFIDVFPLNDSPIAKPDYAMVYENFQLVFNGATGNPAAVAANDTDADGPALWVVAIEGTTNGSAYINTFGDVVFVADPGYSGPAGFDYTVSDGVALSTAHVDVFVQPVAMISTTQPGLLPGAGGALVGFDDSDIIQMLTGPDGASHWELAFDGSDVGLTRGGEDVDAFAFLPNGSILISTTGAFRVPAPGGGVIKGGGSDILQFWYTQLGETTVGYWSLFFDGSDVGLAAKPENIDALAYLPTGQLLISTTGFAAVPGTVGRGEDLLLFTPTSLGGRTAGRWVMYFDGSDVGLSGSRENLNAVYVEPHAGAPATIHFATDGAFKLRGLAGGREDIVAFTPRNLGISTAGSGRIRASAADLGLGGLRIDGVRFGAAPAMPQSLAEAKPATTSRLHKVAPPPPAAYLHVLAALPPSVLIPDEMPPLVIPPPPGDDGPTDPPRLPDGTPISPILVQEVVNRLFSAWGRPGVDSTSLPDLATDSLAVPLFHFFTQVIRAGATIG